MTGIYLFHEIGEENVTLVRTISTAIFMQPNAFFFTDSRKPSNDSIAWFGQGTIHFMDRFHLTGGLRFTDDEKRFSLQIAAPEDFTAMGLTSPVSGTRLFGEQKASEWTPLVSLAVDITDDIMIYATYSEGFRDGGFPPRVLGSPVTIPTYDPEFVEVIEGGIKSTWMDNRVRANIAIFNTDYTEYQSLAVPDTTDPALLTAGIVNLAAATIFGVEFEGQWLVTDNLRFDLTLGYLDDEIDEILGGSAFSVPFLITTDNDLPYTPEWNWNLGVSHQYPLPNGGELYSRVDWTYSDELHLRIENDPITHQDAYSKVNGSMTYRHPGDQWEVVLGVTNLLDDVYAGGAAFSGTSSTALKTVNRPRSVYGTVRYTWGE